MNWPKQTLMVSPEFFDVEYAINPHMLNDKGELNKIDKALATKQWETLKQTFESLGIKVHVIAGQAQLPDMVFCANQTFPFLKEGKLQIVLSKMNSNKRQPEVQYFEAWAKESGITTYPEFKQDFEGMGDALWNYETRQVYAGYGFRTSPEVYSQLEQIIDQKIITLELKDDRFYHLDTCLSILNGTTAAYVKEAFTEEGLVTLKNSFSTLLEVPITEATEQLACNMCTPNGKDVIIQSDATETVKALTDLNFNVIEIDTSEYLKSGGSVFCMKQLLL